MAGNNQSKWRRCWNWLKRFWRKIWRFRRRSKSTREAPFKEFIYLDEISVISLLVSRTGELTAEIQEGWAQEETIGSEVAASVGVKDVSNTQAKSSWQTKSSRSIQATRKANIQSQFRRLHQEVHAEKLLFPIKSSVDFDSADQFISDPSLARRVDDLDRGMLVELDVKLSADPLFDKSAIITEIADIGEQHPEIMGASFGGVLPSQMKSFGKLLDHFMAGLVPVRCTVTNLGRATYQGDSYIVDLEAAAAYGLDVERIELVAVLEKDRFWKDMRRVLFSEAPVTVMGRISVSGLQREWAPVKLLDLFKRTVPNSHDLVAALESLNFDETVQADDQKVIAFRQALTVYAEKYSAEAQLVLTNDQSTELNQILAAESLNVETAESRRNAFRNVGRFLGGLGSEVDADRDAELRLDAMRASGIDAFGNVSTSTNGSTPPTNQGAQELLEVEVVAMYW